MTGAVERAYRPDLDGIRAIAILSVLLGHAGLPCLTGGFTGVDIFFVLSGYLIGGHIYAELRAGAFRFTDFYARRARRILPALLAVVIFALCAGWVLLSPSELAGLGRSAFAAVLSSSNFLYWGTTNYFASKSGLDPMLMTWSLGVEEQFYAVIPLLLVLLARVRREWMLPGVIAVSVLSFAFAWAALANHPMTVFYLLPARAWELGVGVALAIWELSLEREAARGGRAEWIGAAGLALVVAPLFIVTMETRFPGPAALPSVAGTALLIGARSSWLNRCALSFAPLVFIGRISYSLYLWHWPLLAFLRILYGEQLPGGIAAAALCASLLAAVLSYYFVEQPFRRSLLVPRSLLTRYAAVCTLLVAVCVAIWLSGGVPGRSPVLAKIEAESEPLRSDPCLAGYGRDTPNLSANCDDPPVGAAQRESPAVALWGDSHAAALAPGLRAIATAQGYGFVELGKASCPPFIGATHFSPRIPLLAGECLRFNRHVIDMLRNDARIRIVILNADWDGYLYHDWQDGWLAADMTHAKEAPAEDASRKLFVDSVSATARALQSAGKQVIVLDDVPSFAIDPMSGIRMRLIPARRRTAGWLGAEGFGDSVPDDSSSAQPTHDPHAVLASALLARAASSLSGVELLDLKSALCEQSDRCLYRDGETLLYGDSNHLTAAGAVYVTRNLRLPPVAPTAASVAAR